MKEHPKNKYFFLEYYNMIYQKSADNNIAVGVDFQDII